MKARAWLQQHWYDLLIMVLMAIPIGYLIDAWMSQL